MSAAFTGLLSEAMAVPEETRVTRIEFEIVGGGRISWRVWDGPQLLIEAPAWPEELPAVLHGTDLLLGAALGIDPERGPALAAAQAIKAANAAGKGERYGR